MHQCDFAWLVNVYRDVIDIRRIGQTVLALVCLASNKCGKDSRCDFRVVALCPSTPTGPDRNLGMNLYAP